MAKIMDMGTPTPEVAKRARKAGSKPAGSKTTTSY